VVGSAGAERAGALAVRIGGAVDGAPAARKPGPVPSPEQAAAYPYTPQERDLVDPRRSTVVLGDAAKVRKDLAKLRARTGADELMITATVPDHTARYRSYQLIARACGLTES
jgi:alkanesulfonate monooxygenase SsuD/methylene tetrahydromethanopterin reductase-like flavin-dependent oxidoreductase (luciferase family)